MITLNGLFVEEYLFFICDIFFIFSVLILLCLSIYIDAYVKSLYISKLIIDLTMPIVILSFFLSISLNNISVLLEFSLFFFGVSIIYGIFGTLNLFDIAFIIEFYEVYSSLLFISVFFLLSGLIFKLGGAPFH